jgi:hypothetical protein
MIPYCSINFSSYSQNTPPFSSYYNDQIIDQPIFDGQKKDGIEKLKQKKTKKWNLASTVREKNELIESGCFSGHKFTVIMLINFLRASNPF